MTNLDFDPNSYLQALEAPPGAPPGVGGPPPGVPPPSANPPPAATPPPANAPGPQRPPAAAPPPAPATTAPAQTRDMPPPAEGFDPNSYLTAFPSHPDQSQPNMLTDIWPEMKRTAASDWRAIKQGLGPENSEKLAEEEKNTPWWDVGPMGRSILSTGKGLLAAAGAPLGILVGAPARSLIGHPLATAERAITGGESPEKAIELERQGVPSNQIAARAQETPQETYQRWAGNVDTALSLIMPKGSPAFAKAPPTAPGPYEVAPGKVIPAWNPTTKPPPLPPTTNDSYGVTLSEGQRTGDLDAIQRESEARSGAKGPPAQRRAVEFFGAPPYVEGQQPAQLANARGVISERLALPQPAADTPQDAADIISKELDNRRTTSTSNLQQEGTGLASDMVNYHNGLSPGRTPVQDPLRAANIVSGSIAARADQAQSAIAAAYDELGQLPGNFHPATFNNIENVIRRKVSSGPDPTIINAQTTPVANHAVSDLDDVLSGLKQQRDDDGRLIPRPPITPQVVENARKRLNVFMGQALQSARASGNWSDVRAMRSVMDAFDDHVANRLAAGTYMGGDPSSVVGAMQKGRQLYAAYRRTFTPQGSGDAVGKAIQSVLGQYEGQAATPEQVANLLYSGQNAPKIAQRLVQMFGADSPEIGAIRQGYVSHTLEAPPGKPPLNAGQIADRIDAATGGASRQPPTLTRTYFNPQQINDMRALGQRFRQHAGAIEPQLDEAAQLAHDLAGADNAAVVQKVFQRTMKGDETPARMVSRMSPQSQAAFKSGLFRHAVEPIGGIAGWGPKEVGDNLYKLLNATRNSGVYSPEERQLIQGYADLMRKMEVPKAGANWSGTETFRQRYLRGFGGIVGRFVVGDMIAHYTGLPWFAAEGVAAAGTAGYQLMQERLALRRIAKQLPLVSEQMTNYQKALAAYHRSNNIATRKMVATQFSNFARSAQRLGVSPSLLPAPPTAQQPDVRSRAEGGPLEADPNDGPPAPADQNEWNQVPVDASGRPVIYVTPAPKPSLDVTPGGGAASIDKNAQPPLFGGPSGPPGGQKQPIPQQLIPPGPPSPVNAQGQPLQIAPSSDQGTANAVAPGPSPAESEPVPQTRSILDKLLGIGGPRYQLWPERVVRSALSAPGEAFATGQLTERDPYGRVIGVEPEMSVGPTSTDVAAHPAGFPSQTAIQRSQDIAAMQFGSGASAAEEGAAAAAKPAAPAALPAPALMTEAGKPGSALSALEANWWYYSAVERAIANAKQSKMTPDQWIGWLRNQPGVKPEELQWLGLGDKTQLPEELQSGPITKDQLLGHLKENHVQPQLVEKKGPPELSEEGRDELERRLMEEEFTRRYPYSNMEDFYDWRDSSEGQQVYDQVMQQVRPVGGPKYSEHQLPGGSNYRETLLTLPEKELPWSREMGDRVRELEAKMQRGDNLTPDEFHEYEHLNTIAQERDSRSEPFQSSHWDEPNVLLHMRMNDRDIPGVGKDLHLEELQSDWHQKGRRQGYSQTEPMVTAYYHAQNTNVPIGMGKTEEEALASARQHGWDTGMLEQSGLPVKYKHETTQTPGVPDAPFKTTWPDLGLKTAITKAAREGYDSISWTPGEQQAERYDLSKQVDAIRYSKNPDGTYRLGADQKGRDHMISLGDNIPAAKLEDYVGKEIADKIMKGVGQDTHGYGKMLTSVDLKVGGEGMKGFYNKMLVDKANALGKKFGAKVEYKDMPIQKPMEIEVKYRNGGWQFIADGKPFGAMSDPEGKLDYGTVTRIAKEQAERSFVSRLPKQSTMIKVPVLRLTPQLKEQALKGLPLFTEAGRPGAALAGLEDPAVAQQLARNPGASIFDVGGHPEMNPPAPVAAPTIMKGAGSPLGIRSPQIRQLFDRTIGAYMPEKEFADKYLMGMADPETTVIMPSEHFDGAGISVTSSLVDPKTNTHLGSVERHIVPGEAAYHSALEVNPKAPPGFTKRMLQNQIDLYNKMGVRYVDLYANVSVGGYAWAKYGWVPEQGAWDSIRRGNYGIPGRLLKLGRWDNGRGDIDPKVLAAVPKIAANPDPRSIWDIADINAPVPRDLVKGEGRADQYMTYTHPSTKTIGQYLLKGRGWDGRLSLFDPESMDRFNGYIGRGGALPGAKP